MFCSGDKDAENEVILLEHDVPHARFSEAVLACLPPDDWTIPEEVTIMVFLYIYLLLILTFWYTPA